MPVLPKNRVGLISCSGEELPEGTLSRIATLRVLERLRPNETVTLCLPLFLAGDDKERAFARFYPTIAIDGCDERCAARATEKFSAKPAASIVIPRVLAARGLAAPRSRRQADAASQGAADAVAEEIAGQVDVILTAKRAPGGEEPATGNTKSESVTAECSCGSGIPVTRLMIAGKTVEVVALPLILEESLKAGKSADQVFDAIKIYNCIPARLEQEYREAILLAYAGFKAESGRQECSTE